MKSRKTRSFRQRRGFTLLEVLMVLVIIVIIGSLVGVGVFQARRNAMINAARSQVQALGEGAKLYNVEMFYFPEALEDLVTPPNNEADWKGPFLSSPEVPLDPWGNEYQIEILNNGESCRIWSYGPDGTDSDDDISEEVFNY